MMDDNKIKFFFANLGTDWMTFSKNSPTASRAEPVSDKYDHVEIYYRRYGEIMEPTSTMSHFKH